VLLPASKLPCSTHGHGGCCCCLQAWYSAAWSRATLVAFRSALEEVLAPARSQHLPAAVLRFLRHWRAHDVPLATSRKLWLRSMTDTITTELANCKQREDRMAMCSYILTGQLLDAEVGSVAMFAVPEGEGELAFNSSVLQVGSLLCLLMGRVTPGQPCPGS
jgi:hypothetical protein